MYNGFEYINAGDNRIKKYGRKARSFVADHMTANEKGFYSIPCDSKYLTIGTSEGRYGEYAKYEDTFISVNKGGYVWAKEGTAKADAFVEMLKAILKSMKRYDEARLNALESAE